MSTPQMTFWLLQSSKPRRLATANKVIHWSLCIESVPRLSSRSWISNKPSVSHPSHLFSSPGEILDALSPGARSTCNSIVEIIDMLSAQIKEELMTSFFTSLHTPSSSPFIYSTDGLNHFLVNGMARPSWPGLPMR
mmetsp:Transcript_10364/g.12123  ORF Transcript_10364/g.12123 Transcript_10364/m.12123 type:complete len:136 (+) Transcript_10364:1489-1896(+)